MKRSMQPEQMLALGFAAVILAGTVLLALPLASSSGESIGLFDALFTATSCVCVTGLVAVDTGTAFTAFGHVVMLLLIQTGGLGFMIFATMIMAAMGRKITLRSRVLLQESMSVSTMAGLSGLARLYGGIALLVEIIGAAILAVRFVPLFGWGKGLWYSLFHAVSAFCNAGFDLMGNYASLMGLQQEPMVLMTISVLIILGGIGFAVIFEVASNRCRWKGLSLHGRIALLMTAALLVMGTALFCLTEWRNPKTLGMIGGTGHKIVNAFMQSATMRTAGFNSIDLAAMGEETKLISVILMFIGASPASTGGGVKTTTAAVIWLIMLSVVRGHKDVNVMGRRLPTELMRRALSILMMYLLLLLTSVVALTMMEGGRYTVIDMAFEATSALATVGVTSVGTPNLTYPSRTLLMLLMYFGRVGPLTMAVALARKQQDSSNLIRYPEENVMIG